MAASDLLRDIVWINGRAMLLWPEQYHTVRRARDVSGAE